MFKKLVDWLDGATYFMTPLPPTYTEPEREFKDPNRPGLVFTVPPGHVYLCPFEVNRLQKEYDEKIKRASRYKYC